MSKVVDERVVEMRFDNKQFESNVSQSMSTLEKLKRSLNLTGAAKGLDTLSTSVKKVDMSGIGSGVDTLHAKFSALQVIGVTALANITNSAVNAGKRIVSALTIDPVRSGFQEYETQINAVQTILANTQKEGATIKDVNKALDELNLYADKTIYNFTEMTRNIGTFTAAGVDLKTSVSAIQGIANLAAVSGSTSQQASTAMYQLSQALASGTVKLMDWNSVVNAGMGGQVFQDALRETSELLGTGAEAAIALKGSFRESLSKGWLTAEVLTETLKKFTTSGANEYIAEYTGLSQEAVESALKEAEARYGEADAIKYASEALAEKSGKNKEEIESALKFAKTAEDAATKVKTFTQLWDVLKEAAQSGWSQTWRLIVGDFEEAKGLFTPLADFLTGVIGKMSDARNKLLESALGKGFGSLSKKLNSMLEPAKEAVEVVGKVKDSLYDLDEIAKKVILGDFGNGKSRYDALTKSGVNYYTVQNKVNEMLGNSVRHSQEKIDATNKLLGIQNESTKATTEETKETEKLTDSQKDQIKQLAELSDEQLKAKGYTENQIKAFKELRDTADKLGLSVGDLIDNIDDINGRWLLINSFKNVGQSIVKIFSSIGKAWREIFEGIKPESLFNAIAGFHKFTSALVISDETADKLGRTFKGLFALLDIITSIFGGGFKLALKVASKLLGSLDLHILDVTASIGDMIVGLRDFIFDNELINKVFELMADGIKKAVKAIRDLADAFKNLPQVQKFIEKVKQSFEDLKNIDLSDIGENILEGLKNGLSGGVPDLVKKIGDVAKKLIEAFCSLLGIHSPSTVFFEFGTNIVEGLANGIKAGLKWIVESAQKLGKAIVEGFKNIDINLDPLKNAVEKFKEFIKGFDFSKLLALIPIAVVLLFVKKLYDIANTLADGINSINGVITGFQDIEKSFSKVLKSFATEIKAKALLKVAEAIAILVGSVIALSFIDADKLYTSVFTIGILSVILIGLAFAMSKLSDASVEFGNGKLNINGIQSGLISIGVVLLLLATTVKLMGSMNQDQMIQGFVGLAGIITALITVFVALGLLSAADATGAIDKVGSMLIKMGIAMLLMVSVCKLAAGLDENEMKKGAGFAAAFIVFVGLLSFASSFGGKEASKIGSMVLKLSLAMILLVGFCKLAGSLTPNEMLKGAAFAGAFLVFVASLVLISKLFPQSQIQKIGGLVLSVSLSMLLMVGVCKLVGMLKPEDMVKGGIFALAFLGLVALLVKVTTITNAQQTAKVAGIILAFSIAIGLLAAVSILMSMMSIEGLVKGLAAVTVLGLVMAAMIAATRGAEKVVGNLVVMTVAIAIMAGAVAALSMLDPSRLAGATLALTTVMGMFAIIELSSSSIKGSVGTLIVMTIAVGLMGGIIYLLAGLPIESTLSAAASLSLLLLSLSVSMAIMSSVGSVSLGAIGAIAALTIVVAALGGILILLSQYDLSSAMNNVIALSTLLLAMSGVCVILAAVGTMGPAAFIGIGALITLIGSVGLLMGSIGALVTYFPQLEDFLNRGIGILEKIGYGLGSFFGNVVAGLIGGATSGLEELGTTLSNFMTNLQPFLDGANSIDENAVNGVKALASAILALTGANLVESITSFLTGGSSLADFANQLVPFGFAMKAYSVAVTGINTEAITASANAAKALTEVAKAVPKEGGLWQMLSGENDLGSFGAKLVPFGLGMKMYSMAVAGINTEAITASATAAKGLTDVANAVPKKGGIWQMISGDKDLGSFGTKLVPFGMGMKAYSMAVVGINNEAITASVSSAKSLVNVAKAVPKEGGLWGMITGDKDLGSFCKKLIPFGESMKTYSQKVSGIDSASISGSVSAAKAMVNVAKAIPKNLKVGADSESMSTFGSKLSQFATAMKNYSAKVSGISSGPISNSASAVRSLVSVLKSTAGINTSGVSSFVTAINTLGKAQISKFVSAFTSSTGKLKSAGANMISAVVSGIKSSQSALSTTVTGIVKYMYNAFSSKSAMFKSAGAKLMAQFASGIASRKSSVNSAVSSTVSSAASKLRANYSGFYSAGMYVARGFANGIKANSYLAEAKAKAMANAAERAAKKALDINSPSKVFRRIGYGVPEGFAQGIDRMAKLAVASTNSMAKDTIGTAVTSMAHIASILDSDIDSNPTIRPVIDLSDVQSGAAAINGMFGNGISIGANANLNAISASMSQKSQNGVNGDIISAINNLGKQLGNVGNTTYQVNGITYDDGSNVANAVYDIVRAARVERRK